MTAYVRNIADKVLHQPAMLKEQEFHLGTIEKFTHYGRVPCKMILNMIVGLLLLIRVSIYMPGDNKYIALANERLGVVFSPDWDGASNTDVNMYSFDELGEFLEWSREAYTSLPSDSAGTWILMSNQTMEVTYLTPPLTYKDALSDPTRSLPDTTIYCSLEDAYPLGPFTPTDDGESDPCYGISNVKWKVNHAEIKFRAHSIRQVTDLLTPVCYAWDVTQVFEFDKAGIIKFDLVVEGSLCGLEGLDNGFGATMDYVAVFLLLFAVWGLVLRGKSVRRIRKLRKILQMKLAGGSGRSSAFTLQGISPEGDIQTATATTISTNSTNLTRMEFFHEALDTMTTTTRTRKGYSWLLAGMLGDAFVIASCICDLYIYHTTSTVSSAALITANVFLGLGSFVQWSVFVAHLGDQPWLFLLINSLRKGTPIALRFIAGCLPFYLGYALLGCHIFGARCFRFVSFDKSAVSLFAVLNGDVVHETFSNMFPDQNTWLQFFSRFYMYSFIILFIYVILNIFLAIMEDTYFQLKQALVSDLQDDLKK